MTTRRLNKTVNALRALLVRNEIHHPDKVAKLLLQGIQMDDQWSPVINLSSKGPFSAVIDKTLSTTELRSLLVKAGLVVQTSFGDYKQWTVAVSPKLEEYRMKFKAERDGYANPVLAMNALEARIEKKQAKAHKRLEAHFNGQIQALWSAIKHIEQHDAPVTVEKIERHLKAV